MKPRTSKKRELGPSRFKKVKFKAGEHHIIKEINVKYEYEDELVEIELKDIVSRVTKKNLLMFQTLYRIKWNKVIRYPVQGRYGYIIEGEFPTGRPITFIRKELNHKGSGSTEVWFGNGYKLPAPKVLRVHQIIDESIEYWGPSIKQETIEMWCKMTSSKLLLYSYSLSKLVYNQEKLNQPWKYKDEIISWIVSIAEKLDKDDYLNLLNQLQKIQFERL